MIPQYAAYPWSKIKIEPIFFCYDRVHISRMSVFNPYTNIIHLRYCLQQNCMSSGSCFQGGWWERKWEWGWERKWEWGWRFMFTRLISNRYSAKCPLLQTFLNNILFLPTGQWFSTILKLTFDDKQDLFVYELYFLNKEKRYPWAL